MYADMVTGSMRRAIDETERRRKVQTEYNSVHGIIPKTTTGKPRKHCKRIAGNSYVNIFKVVFFCAFYVNFFFHRPLLFNILAISIDQKTTSHNPRSTVGTQFFDFVRNIFQFNIVGCGFFARYSYRIPDFFYNGFRNNTVHTVILGLNFSSSSTLAFDTIFAEGQRRYIESLSSYARQFLGQMEKPEDCLSAF